MFTTLASKLFTKSASSPRRASAIRKQQVLRQSAAYYGDVYNEFDVYEQQNPWVELADDCEEEVIVKAPYVAEVKPVKAENLQPSVSQLLKKLAVSIDQRPAPAPAPALRYSSMFPPPPLASTDRAYAMATSSSSRRGIDFGVGLPPAA